MNNKILLLTSIPPSFIRKNGGDIIHEKLQWQKICINSWINSGHEILSINEESEIEKIKPLFPEINFHRADRTTRNENGRPLIYISDAINLSKIFPYPRIAICNSDVTITRNLMAPAIQYDDESVYYSNRVNIESINSTIGEPFGGIDYFNMPRAFCINLPETCFAFGLPWWDYWLPLNAAGRGFNLKKLLDRNGSPILLHMKHPDAWNPRDFFALGRHFFNLITSSFSEAYSTTLLNDLYKLIDTIPTESEMISILASQARLISQNISDLSTLTLID